MKTNYQIELERELARIEASGRRPRLLLHCCCAPCSSYVLEYLNRWLDIDLYYYNPNIAPREEFDHRAAELIRLAETLPHAGEFRVIVGDYDADAFAAMCRGHEDDPEGGARCERCFRMRLGAAAKLARQRLFHHDAVHQPAEGRAAAERHRAGTGRRRGRALAALGFQKEERL